MESKLVDSGPLIGDSLPADDAISAPAAAMADPDSAAAQGQRRLFEKALKTARPRPLVISRLRTCGDASGYSGCHHGDASLLSAFCIQVLVSLHKYMSVL